MVKFISLIFLLLWVNLTFAQNSFDFLYATEDDEKLLHGRTDTDGNVVLCGSIGDRYGNKDALVMKVFPDGTYITKRIPSNGTNGYFMRVEITSDSNYVFFGTYSSVEGEGPSHLWIYETDTLFNLLTEKTYIAVDDYYHACYVNYTLKDNDGNWIFAGTKYDEQFFDLWMCKLNENYDTILNKTFKIGYKQSAYELTIVPNTNEYMVIGGRFDPITSDIELLRMDSLFNRTGFTNVPKYYPNKYLWGQVASSDLWVSDTSLIITTTVPDTSDKRIQDDHIGVFKIDTAGGIHNKLILGKTDTLDYVAWNNSMATVNKACIYMGAFVTYLSFWPDKESYLELYMVDTGLNLLGYTQFGGDAYYELWGILPTADSGCLMYGTRYDSETDEHEYDVQIVKFNKEDLSIITSAETISSADPNAIPFPNPVREHISIPLPVGKTYGDLRLQIYTLSGKKVTDKPVTGQGNLIRTRVKPLPEGIYIFRVLSSGKTIASGKFMKH